MNQKNKLLSIKEAANLLGVSVWTLRQHEGFSDLEVIRTAGNHRRYLLSDIEKIQGVNNKKQDNLVAIYARVSSNEQKQKGDLDRQQSKILDYCVKNDYKVGFTFQEVGSGMSDTRSKLNKLCKLVSDQKVSKVIISYKDRLTRFNFGIYKTFFNSYGVDIEWIEDTLPKSYEAELVEDMLSLMSSFSARIYGKRSSENRRKKKLEKEANTNN